MPLAIHPKIIARHVDAAASLGFSYFSLFQNSMAAILDLEGKSPKSKK